MKYKILLVITIPFLFFCESVIIYELAFTDKSDKLILAAAVILFIAASMLLLKIRPDYSLADKEKYADKYKDTIGNAFQNDKKSYKQLIKAIIHLNYYEYDKAIKKLDILLKTSCAETCDYSAVLAIKALCLESRGLENAAIETYESLLTYDNSNSDAWFKLGFLYSKKGESAKCEKAYINAIRCNPENALAHNNLSVLYFNRGDNEKALEYALRAIELKPKMHQAIGTAALTLKMLRDYESSEKYLKLYILNGGNADSLKKALERVKINN